jgi:sarcosine oxidase subunit beta
MNRGAFGAADTRLPEAVDIAIVGGGVMGLSTAYNLQRLAKRRLTVAVLERSYLVSGASGRNGGGVRMQFGDAGHVELMMESIEICRGLAQELGINVWFRQGGYLFVARSERAERALERNAALHRELGAPTRLLAPSEARDVVPELAIDDVRLAAYNPEDGVVFPWPFVWGYAAQAVAGGVFVRTHTEVSAIEPISSGFELHLAAPAPSAGATPAPSGRLRATRVINATGAWCHGLNDPLGIHLPNRPHRHEILSTEPLKPFLEPLVADLDDGLYFSQSTRGEIVAGVRVPEVPGDPDPGGLRFTCTSAFLATLGRTLPRLLPIAGQLRVLRQWSGPYDVSPDGDAIVGPSPGHPGLIQVCGFTGHGFMMAPVVGPMLARWLVRDERHPLLERWSPARFAASGAAPTRREDMIIG